MEDFEKALYSEINVEERRALAHFYMFSHSERTSQATCTRAQLFGGKANCALSYFVHDLVFAY